MKDYGLRIVRGNVSGLNSNLETYISGNARSGEVGTSHNYNINFRINNQLFYLNKRNSTIIEGDELIFVADGQYVEVFVNLNSGEKYINDIFSISFRYYSIMILCICIFAFCTLFFLAMFAGDHSSTGEKVFAAISWLLSGAMATEAFRKPKYAKAANKLLFDYLKKENIKI